MYEARAQATDRRQTPEEAARYGICFILCPLQSSSLLFIWLLFVQSDGRSESCGHTVPPLNAFHFLHAHPSRVGCAWSRKAPYRKRHCLMRLIGSLKLHLAVQHCHFQAFLVFCCTSTCFTSNTDAVALICFKTNRATKARLDTLEKGRIERMSSQVSHTSIVRYCCTLDCLCATKAITI